MVVAGGAGTPASGQEGESPLVPGGLLKIEASPLFLSWSSRFGSGGTEPLAAPLIDATGALLFPGISRLEGTLRDWLGEPELNAVLGGSRALVTASRVRVPLRAEVGLLDRVTIGVMVPLVRNRTEVEFAFRADSATANLGVNPALRSPTEVLAFTNELRARSESAAQRASQLCAEAPASPECAAADGVARDGGHLLTGFLSSYSASPFFPLSTSSAARTLQQRVGSFNQGLASLGLPALARQPLFPDARVDADDLQALLSDPAVGIGTVPLQDQVGVWELGDIEVNAAIGLLAGESRDSAAPRPRFAYEVGAGVLVRVGTGSEDDPNVFLDLATGDGQTDVEGRAFATLRSGRFGLWSDLRLGFQRPRTIVRRVGPPDLVLVPAVNSATVEWTPGSYLQLEVSPRYHFTDELAFTGGYRLYSKGEDEFVRVSPAPDPQDTSPLPSPPLYTDVSLLAVGSEETLHEVGGGLLFSTLAAWEEGRASRPFELRFNVLWAMSGSGRTAADGVRALVGLRLYLPLWGN